MPSPTNLPQLRDRAFDAHRKGQLVEAAALYRQIIAAEPGDFRAHYMLGILCCQEGRYPEGLAEIGAALAINPDETEALSNYGLVLDALGRPAEALIHYDRALARFPDAATLTRRGNALLALKRFDEALDSYDKALAIAPADSDALNNRGATLTELMRFEEAIASYDRAIALNASNADAFHNRGNALWYLRRCEEALASYDRALALKPHFAKSWSGRGIVLAELMRFDDATASYDRAIAAAPAEAGFAQFYKGLTLLLQGRLEEGWPLHEVRAKPPVAGKPAWTGAQDLAGKTLFLRWEMGLGDTLQFCRYALLAEAKGARVILSVQNRLRRLLTTLSPGIEIVGEDAIPAQFDYHCALMSLPHAFGTRMDTIPADVPYLHAEPERTRHWRARIGDHGFKIGVNWQGATLGLSHSRPFPLAALAGVARLPGVRLISLQKNAGVEQLQSLPPGMVVETLGDDFDAGADAFLDTAAAMQSLDLIITTDTSMAHLAGALARPTWLALKHVPSWQWLLHRTDSPWYPSLRLFRQASRDDWPSVFAAMEAELKKRL